MTDSSKKQSKTSNKKKSILGERLIEGEKILCKAVISPYIFWQSGVLLIFALFVYFMVPTIGILLFIVTALKALYDALRKQIFMLVVTNKRILTRYGILQVDVVDLHFKAIESIELERMLTGYLMGYSNVVIMGTGQRYIVIPYVANGPTIRRTYNNLVLGEEDNKEQSPQPSATEE